MSCNREPVALDDAGIDEAFADVKTGGEFYGVTDEDMGAMAGGVVEVGERSQLLEPAGRTTRTSLRTYQEVWRRHS